MSTATPTSARRDLKLDARRLDSRSMRSFAQVTRLEIRDCRAHRRTIRAVALAAFFAGRECLLPWLGAELAAHDDLAISAALAARDDRRAFVDIRRCSARDARAGRLSRLLHHRRGRAIYHALDRAAASVGTAEPSTPRPDARVPSRASDDRRAHAVRACGTTGQVSCKIVTICARLDVPVGDEHYLRCALDERVQGL